MALLLACVSFGLLACGIYMLSLYRSQLRYTGSAHALVVDFAERRGDEDGSLRHAVLQYTVDGTEYLHEDRRSRYGRALFSLGQLVDIRYNSNNPSRCWILGNDAARMQGVLLSILGIIVLLSAIISI